jgi:hypothetical protein
MFCNFRFWTYCDSVIFHFFHFSCIDPDILIWFYSQSPYLFVSFINDLFLKLKCKIAESYQADMCLNVLRFQILWICRYTDADQGFDFREIQLVERFERLYMDVRKLLYYLGFQSFKFQHTWRKLLQKLMLIHLSIYILKSFKVLRITALQTIFVCR